MKKSSVPKLIAALGVILAFNTFASGLTILNRTNYPIEVSGIVGTHISKTLIEPGNGKTQVHGGKNYIMHLMLVNPASKNYYNNIILRKNKNKVTAFSLYRKEKITVKKDEVVLG